MDGDNQLELSSNNESTNNKRVWVAPDVSESPINELTQENFSGIGADGGLYS